MGKIPMSIEKGADWPLFGISEDSVLGSDFLPLGRLMPPVAPAVF